jgi:hypothetical protein
MEGKFFFWAARGQTPSLALCFPLFPSTPSEKYVDVAVFRLYSTDYILLTKYPFVLLIISQVYTVVY